MDIQIIKKDNKIKAELKFENNKFVNQWPIDDLISMYEICSAIHVFLNLWFGDIFIKLKSEKDIKYFKNEEINIRKAIVSLINK